MSNDRGKGSVTYGSSTVEFGHSATKEMIVEIHTISTSMNHLPDCVSFFFFYLIDVQAGTAGK